jgi:hypothetical protein
MKIRSALALLALVGFGAVATAAQAQTPPKKILFLAGPKEHGAPGRHEYERDLRELAWSLENATNFKGITTQVIVGKPPRDLKVYEDAAAIVIVGNGDWLRNETGMLFQQAQDTDGRAYDAETTAFLKAFDTLIKQKQISISMWHYTMWNDNWAGKRYMQDWLGGIWIPYASHNPVDTWTIKTLPVKHPILNGVNPWEMREEMYARYLLYTDPRRTDLLTGTAATPRNGGPDTIAWAYERPDGGRGFVWGGADFHDNLHTKADYRRFLMNAMAWLVKLDVPAGGIQAPPQAADPPFPPAPARGGRGGPPPGGPGRGAAPGTPGGP